MYEYAWVYGRRNLADRSWAAHTGQISQEQVLPEHLELDAMGEKEIKNVLELVVSRTAKNEARRQSRRRGSELMSMRLSQRKRLA